jgi:cyclopropane fatty-acyl-phospholipid synthase-like methyltransferase
MVDPEHIARMEFVYGSNDEELSALLDESLDPRSPDFLLDMGASLLTAGSRLLDIGCRDARHLIPLVERTGCTGVGIDPVARNLERARAAVSAAGLDHRIEIRNGVMEHTGEPDDSIDLVWCRDVLEVVPDLEGGMKEVSRILKPGGAALIYAVVATRRLEPGEVGTFDSVGNVSRNLDRSILEGAVEKAGLRIEGADEIRTEFREYEEERTNRVSASLLRLARLRRREPEIVERFGRERYDLWDASLQWLAFLFLGKLEPIAYVLRRA